MLTPLTINNLQVEFSRKIEKVRNVIQGEIKTRHEKLGKTGLNNWNIRSKKKGRNQVSGRVSDPCWHATPIAHAPWKPFVVR